jgi:serine/threonine protein phosphatase PrpC
VTPEAIVEAISENEQAIDASEVLVKLANAAGGPDNISVALYRHRPPLFDPDAPTIRSE